MPRPARPRLPAAAGPPPTAVTADRAARLAKLLKLIARAPKPRTLLLDKLKLDDRGFYRDLKTLRGRGVVIRAADDAYRLMEDLDAARGKLPFPDPMLCVADAVMLAKGNTDAHRRLRAMIEKMNGGSNGVHRPA